MDFGKLYERASGNFLKALKYEAKIPKTVLLERGSLICFNFKIQA
jgi:hypothetical protein